MQHPLMSKEVISLSISITDISCIRVHLFHIFKAFPHLYYFLIKALFLRNQSGTLKRVTGSKPREEHLPDNVVACLSFLKGRYDEEEQAFYKSSHIASWQSFSIRYIR